MDWIRLLSWHKASILMIWRAILYTLPTIRDGLVWRIKFGISVHINMDPCRGCDNMYRLPPDLINFLNDRGINLTAHIFNSENSTIFAKAWKSTDLLGIPVQGQQVWVGYISTLTESYVCTLWKLKAPHVLGCLCRMF